MTYQTERAAADSAEPRDLFYVAVDVREPDGCLVIGLPIAGPYLTADEATRAESELQAIHPHTWLRHDSAVGRFALAPMRAVRVDPALTVPHWRAVAA